MACEETVVGGGRYKGRPVQLTTTYMSNLPQAARPTHPPRPRPAEIHNTSLLRPAEIHHSDYIPSLTEVHHIINFKIINIC